MKYAHEYRVPKIALAIDGRLPRQVTHLMEACGGQTPTPIAAEAILETPRGDPDGTRPEIIGTVGNPHAGWVTMRTEFGSTRVLADNPLPGIANHA